jgi:acyl phosphate:glycerol-3-phosphate acyltransferase
MQFGIVFLILFDYLLGPSWGVLATALDALKGVIAVEVGVAASLPLAGILLGGAAALLGHQFPLFLRGRGGKGLSTGLGVLLSLSPASTVCGLLVLGLAYFAFHDFNVAIVPGAIAVILLPIPFRQPLWVPAYAIGLALLLAAKKLLDRPHEQRVWASHPWRSAARPGWTSGADEEAPAPDTRPR